ncbi:DNA primase [Geitlerinema sp. FC II]|nr:DNA primase [Geitlerinema sp. FC II]
MSPRLRSDSTLSEVEASEVEALKFGFRITLFCHSRNEKFDRNRVTLVEERV